MPITVHNSPIHDCCFLCQFYRMSGYMDKLPEGISPDEPYCSANKVSLKKYADGCNLIRTNCEHFEGVVEFTLSEVLENGWG